MREQDGQVVDVEALPRQSCLQASVLHQVCDGEPPLLIADGLVVLARVVPAQPGEELRDPHQRTIGLQQLVLWQHCTHRCSTKCFQSRQVVVGRQKAAKLVVQLDDISGALGRPWLCEIYDLLPYSVARTSVSPLDRLLHSLVLTIVSNFRTSGLVSCVEGVSFLIRTCGLVRRAARRLLPAAGRHLFLT